MVRPSLAGQQVPIKWTPVARWTAGKQRSGTRAPRAGRGGRREGETGSRPGARRQQVAGPDYPALGRPAAALMAHWRLSRRPSGESSANPIHRSPREHCLLGRHRRRPLAAGPPVARRELDRCQFNGRHAFAGNNLLHHHRHHHHQGHSSLRSRLWTDKVMTCSGATCWPAVQAARLRPSLADEREATRRRNKWPRERTGRV